MTLTD